MRRLVYVSRSLIDPKATSLDEIVQRSSVRNAAVGVTGMLWFDGTNFAQVLEGEHKRVGETVDRIGSDPRHTDFEVVLDREVQGRAFGSWGMVRPDDRPETLAGTAFLVGLSLAQGDQAAKRLYDIVIACEQ